MKDARRISVSVTDGQLKLTPQRSLGSKEGFEPIASDAVFMPVGDWRAAAATVLRLLGQA